MSSNTSHISSQTSLLISRLYVALFGRAPEVGGMAYWAAQLEKGVKLEQVAQDMFNVTPSRAYYPAELDNAGIITKFYTQVLGRMPDQDGVTYWTKRLDTLSKNGSTSEKALAQGTVIVEILNAVVAYQGGDAAGLQSQSLFNNKVEVAQKFALEISGTDIQAAATLLSKVQAGVQGKMEALDYLKNAGNSTPFFGVKELNVLATEDLPLTGTLLANDKDIGDFLSFTLATSPKHGVLKLNPDGSYLYTPQHDYFGPDSFTVVASDSAGASASQTLNITINSVNDAPVSNADTIYLSLPGTFPFPVLWNDSDDSGNTITISSYTKPQYGNLEFIDGKLTYSTPSDLAITTDSFTYVIQDEAGVKSLPATVKISINRPPSFMSYPQSFSLKENSEAWTSVGFAATSSLNGDGSWDWSIVSGNEKGNFTINIFTGEISVTSHAKIDAEEQEQYKLIVSTRLSSGDKPYPDILNLIEYRINISDINEFTPSITGNDQFSINENTTIVGKFNAIDRDLNASYFTFRIEGADADKFSISASGELSFLTPPDFESPKSSKGSSTYEINLIANDGKFDSAAKVITITVVDVLNAPPFMTVYNGDNVDIETIGLSISLENGFFL